MSASPADICFDLSFKSPVRQIVTNDFQLSILKRGLIALRPAENQELTPAQQYEGDVLLDMIDEVLKMKADKEMVHGFVI